MKNNFKLETLKNVGNSIKRTPLYIKIMTMALLLIIACFFIANSMINNRLNMINRNFSTAMIAPEDVIFDDDTAESDFDWAVHTMQPDEWKVNESIDGDKKRPIVTEAPVPVSEWPDDIEPITDKNVVNILMIGEDKLPGEKVCRSDTMILLTINKNTDSVKLTSFLRDSYVQIPGYKDNKLNSAYSAGGVKLLNKTITKNFGVVIDANVAIDFEDFKKIIDILGGVTINITEKEANHLNSLGYSVKSGQVDMDGKLALEYSRIRKIDSDFYRTARQRRVLTTLFNEFKDKSWFELYSISDEILPLITTDMSNSEIMDYMKYVISLNLDEIESYRIPADNTYYNSWVRRMSVVRLDLSDNRNILKNYLYDEK